VTWDADCAAPGAERAGRLAESAGPGAESAGWDADRAGPGAERAGRLAESAGQGTLCLGSDTYSDGTGPHGGHCDTAETLRLRQKLTDTLSGQTSLVTSWPYEETVFLLTVSVISISMLTVFASADQ